MPPKARHDPQLIEADKALHQGDPARARALFLAVAQRQPRNAPAHAGAGMAAARLGAIDEAVTHLTRAAELDARKAIYHRILGLQQRNLGRLADAAASLERATWLDHADAEAPADLASTLEQMGELERASKALDTALKRNPNHARAAVLRARIALRTAAESQPDLPALARDLAPIANATDNPLAAGDAWSAIGEIRERLADHAGAFDAFTKQNECEIQRTGHNPTPEQRDWFLGQIAAQHTGLTSEMTRRWADESPDDALPSPALLVGFPRSGTTLTERALAAHPRLASIEEKRTFEAAKLHFLEQAGAEAVRAKPIVELLDAATPDQIASLRALYWKTARDALGKNPSPDDVVLDKMPLRIAELSFVNRLFPDARVLVALRDPRDVCLSCFRQRFEFNRMMSFFLRLEDTAALYAAVMRAWLDARDVYANPWAPVRYEDTVTDLRASVGNALEFLGLPWDDDVSRFHETTGASPSITPSYAAVRQKVHTGAVARWKNYETQLQPILPTLEPFIETLGNAK